MTRPDSDEPDYRFTLANERTFLAWIRTALALLAAGIGVVALPGRFSTVNGRRALGVMLVLLACVAAAAAYRRWRGNDSAMRADRPLPRSSAVPVLAVGLVLITLTAFALVLADLS
jgi:putative membrane protein